MCKPTAVQKNKTNVQQNQVQKNEQEAQALLKQFQVKQDILLQNKMMEDQLFKTYKEDQDTYQKKWPLSSMHELDSKVFNDIKEELKSDRTHDPDGDMDVSAFMNKKVNDTKTILSETDNYQKSKGYKSVEGHEKMMAKSFSFGKYVFSKEQVEAIKGVKETDKDSIENAVKAVDTAIAKCRNIKTKARQKASDDNFEVSELKKDQEQKINNLKSIWDLLSNFDVTLKQAEQPDGADIIFGKKKFRSYSSSWVKFKKDKKEEKETFDWDKVKIIRSCMVKGSGKSVRSMEDTEDLKAFTDEMTVAIAKMIAEFLVEKYNIDQTGADYEKLLINLISTRYFNQDKHVINIENLNMKSADNKPLKELDFAELFKKNGKRIEHDPIEDLLKLRDYSEQVLQIEEEKAYKDAGSKRVDSLTEPMVNAQTHLKNTLSVVYTQMGKYIDEAEANFKKRIADPEIDEKIKAEIEAKLNTYNSYKQKLIEFVPGFDLKGRSVNDIKLTEIVAIGKDSSYEDIQQIGKLYLSGIEKVDDFSWLDKNEVNFYEAAASISDCTNKLSDMVKVTTEKEGDKETKQIRTTHINITDEAVADLKTSMSSLEENIEKMAKLMCIRNQGKHPELQDYAGGVKFIFAKNFFDKNLKPEYELMAKELKSSDVGGALLTTYSELLNARKAIDQYCNDLKDIISKKEDVKEYYSNISEVETNLEAIKRRLNYTYLDPATNKGYLKADEFKAKFEAMLAMHTDMYSASKSDKNSEQLKIDVGRKTYKLLEDFEKFKNELAGNASLRNSVQGRKLIEKTVLMQESLVDRLVEEKKEELAFYEGNLLKIKIDTFRTKNGKIDEKIENLRKQNENRNSADAEDTLLKYVEEYNALMEDMDAYLERYAELKNNSYYVKEVAVVKEAVTRQLRSIDNAKLFSCYKDLLETDEYSDSIHKGAYSDEDKLADKYKAFREKVSGRDKLGSFDNKKKIDEKTANQLEITKEEIEEGLNSVLDIALVSARMNKAGLKAADILQKMNYPGDIMTDINADRGVGTFISLLSHNKATQDWFEAKAKQFVASYEKVLEKTIEKVEKTFKDRSFYSRPIAEYIVAHTQVGTQIEVIQQLGKALRFKPKGALEKLNDINLNSDREAVSLDQGFEENNKDILYEEGLKAYSELKADNNREVVYKRESQAILDKLTAFNADLGKDELKFTADYNKLLEVEKLRTSNSKEFDDVKRAAAVVNDLSSEMKNLATDPQLYSKGLAKEKLDAINQAYDDLLKATRTYITTRSVFYRGWSDSGKDRLAAIKEIEAHAKAQKAAYAALEIPMVAYKKDETIDVSAYVQKLNAFKEQKKDLYYDTFVEFKDQFKELLDYNGSEDTLDSTAGVNLFVDLKKEELLLQKQAAKEIIAGAEKIRLECTKTDAKANRVSMYSKWIRCFDFYKKYENSCPQDAKEAVESIRVMARDYLNGREAEGVVTNLNEEKKELHALALKIAANHELSTEEKARVMRLRLRYDSFMTGVKKFKSDYKKDPGFITDYQSALEDFELINKKVASYCEDPATFKEILGSAKTKMDNDLTRAREIIASHAYVLTDMKGKAALTIKNTLEEITYFFSLYVYNKENSGISEEEIKFYNAQKNNLEELLTSNIAKMLVEEDYGAVYEKKSAKEKAEAGYTSSLKNIVPVDKRMEEYEAYMNKTAGERAEEKISKEDQLSHTLRYIVQVEAENAQLQGVQTLRKTSVHMANELEKQLEVRTQFEKQLVGLDKKKDKEKIASLMTAMVNTAGDYYRLLKAKENKILGQQMSTDQERMLYYFTSFSKYYDEAKIYVTMIKKWSNTLGVKLSGSNYTKLADIVGRIDLKAQENIRFNHITDADLNAKKKLDYLKNEATLAAYATQKVCKERDEDFSYTMQHIREVRLNSANSFRVNDLVKESRIFGGDKKYDSLKVEKSKNLTLFGFTVWGKVDYSLNDFIARVFKYTLEYEELKQPLDELIMLSGLASVAVVGDSKTQADAIKQFTVKLENINLKLLTATSKMVTNHSEIGHRRRGYRIDADRRYVMEGWTEFYQTFKELGKQLNDYVDRNPSGENVVLNSMAKKQHASFAEQMAKIGTGATDVASQEKRFFAVMNYINENQYAESAYEHSSNVEYTMCRDYLVSWFENLCYKEAQSALRAIEMIDKDNAKALSEQYDGFLNILEKYAASKAISRKTHDYLKAYVFNACKKKNNNMQDKSVKELAKIRANVVYDNAIAEFDIESYIDSTPEIKEILKKRGLVNASVDKLKASMVEMIQDVAYNAALQEIRGTKVDKLSDTSEQLLEDSALLLAGAQKVTYSVGGWWFILKDYFNYVVGETQAACFKVKTA